jgi:large subunit ribosomal protein L23
MPKEIPLYEVIRRPLITEKSTMLAGQRKYVFEVAQAANKPQIKQAVQKAFDVTVEDVNTAMVRGRRRRNRYGRRAGTAPTWKTAIVTLAPGSTIEFFEGV